jgi:MshEN domain
MKLRRRSVEPVEVEHVYQFEDGSTKVETVHEGVEDDREGTEPSAPAVPAAGRRPSLATLLTEAGLASDAQIHEALEEGVRTGEKLGEVVVRRGWASEGRLAQLLAEQWGLPAVDPGALSLDPLAVARVEVGVASELGGFPVWFNEQGIVVAVSEPNEERFAAFRERLGNVSFVVVPRSTLSELVESRLFGAKGRDSVGVANGLHANGFNGASSTNGQPHLPVEEQFGELPVDVPEDALPVAESPQGEVEAPPASVPAEGSLAERLRGIEAEVQVLEQTLGDTRRTVEAQEAEMAALRESHVQDLDRIRGLEAELAERGDRLDALRQKVADLSLAFED